MGPKAPKDAEKARAWFYIMQGKEVFAQKQGNGTFIHPVYENDGRLLSAARIAGNITDESMIDLLKTSDGFRKLVHSIGVSAESDADGELGFCFQMYGKTDVYGGGSTLTGQVTLNGPETRIFVGDFQKTEDEYEPGQIRFVFPHGDMLAKVKVKFYLNDGFTAPEPVTDEPVDFGSLDYHKMILGSQVYKGNLQRLKKAMEKARSGERTTVSFIGGSITQGAGATPINTECYAYKAFLRFKELTGAGDNLKFVKAGVGGTPSELGVTRFNRDIVRDEEPDVVIIEFAVNDEGDETKGNCFESLARMALKLKSRPAVVLLFAVFANDWNLYDRLSPAGFKLELPMVDVKAAVSPQFTLKPGEGRVISKNAYFYDIFHPTNDGHTIMADCLKELFVSALESNDEDHTDELLSLHPAIGASFDSMRLIDRSEGLELCSIEEGSFSDKDGGLQCVEMDLDLQGTPEFPNNWMYRAANGDEPFKISLTCRNLMIIYKDSGDLKVTKAEAWVDGKMKALLDPHINGWVHCNPKILVDEEKSEYHEIEIRPVKRNGDDEFTILGFSVTL